jgi:hypothetical protein
MTTCTRRRYDGPLSIDPRIARLLRVHLRLPRALVEEVLRAQCYTEVWRYSDGEREEIPFVNGKWHGTVKTWRANGARDEIPYVRGEAHGTATWWCPDGSRECEFLYVNGETHGPVTWWRADGTTVERVEE